MILGQQFVAAFCGFYISGADATLVNDATQVALMRDGTRTVLSMQNDYKGPPEDFALVVPVPVVLQKENVKTLAKDVFARLDTLTAPRLVEYWEENPCPDPSRGMLGHGEGAGSGQGFGNGSGRLGGGGGGVETSVKVEAQFEVGEYEIVILSAKDSAGLDTWLRENKYKIPDTAGAALKPYVEAGSKFFVAKVNVAKVAFENGRAALSPLRFYYDAEKLELPVKLGLLNSAGTQDLVVYLLGSDRYEVANYPNVAIPTNLDVSEKARDVFGPFYASLYDHTVEKNPNAVVTEYSWQASSCDPCPGDITGLTATDMVSLGADVMPSMTVHPGTTTQSPARLPSLRALPIKTSGGDLPPEVIERIIRQNFGRYRLCYTNGLKNNPVLSGKVNIHFDINAKGEVVGAKKGGDTDLPDASVVDCVVQGFGKLNFPEVTNKKTVSVDYGIAFTPEGGGGGRTSTTLGSVSSSKGPLVVTRLHARYGKGSLGADLVFRAAAPITGGRETWSDGRLEHGAISTTETSSFQARYAIRHPWPGPVACAEPKRNVWGGPWPDADAATNHGTASATKLGLEQHGAVGYGSLLGANVDVAGTVLVRDAGAPDGGTADAKPTSKCGCRAVGEPAGSNFAAIGGLFLAVVAALRRRR